MNSSEHPTVLALDIGGTKTLAALVQNGQVLSESIAPTDSAGPALGWIDSAVVLASAWKGKYSLVSAAVTGLVDKGLWSPLNPKTLNVPEDFPIVQALEERFSCPATAMNDAQAAAWGEYRYGAGQRSNMVFLTVSTGLGGGIVINGHLLQGRHGVAGHFGVSTYGSSLDQTSTAVRLEDTLSGRWMAAQAAEVGHDSMSAKDIFKQSQEGVEWAQALVRTSAQRFAALCAHIQLVFAPDCIVVGGGIGVAPGYVQQVQEHLELTTTTLRPRLISATLGVHAGVIGASDFAAHFHHQP